MMRLTRQQVRAVDRIAIERYHVPGVVLMENAARGVVDAMGDLLAGGGPIGILCGPGNNGGDGLAVARHLHNRGCDVSIILATDPAGFKGDALIQWRIVRAMGLHCVDPDPRGRAGADALGQAAVIVDALFGTGLARPVDESVRPYINACNDRPAAGRPVVAVDVPSGLDCDTGRPLGACVRATRTVTFVAEKAGFAAPGAREYLGEVIVADIGCPNEAIGEAQRL
jgi:NAD(P)H-hydrate epimerase